MWKYQLPSQRDSADSRWFRDRSIMGSSGSLNVTKATAKSARRVDAKGMSTSRASGVARTAATLAAHARGARRATARPVRTSIERASGAGTMPSARRRVLADDDSRRRDDVDDAARPADPRPLERLAPVHTPHRRVARRSRIVRDDVAARGEPDDHEEMAVGAVVVEEARE